MKSPVWMIICGPGRCSGRYPAALVALVVLLLWTRATFAQELEPRSLTNVPVGVNFAVVGYGYSAGDILLDPAVPIEDLDAKLHMIVGGYVRSIDFFGRSGKVDVIVPFAAGDWKGVVSGRDSSTVRNGFGDPRVRLSVNFVGAPALRATEEVELWTASELTEGFEDFSISDWDVTLQRSVVRPIVIPSTGKHLSHVEYQMGAERYVGYYLWVMCVPLVFIVLMAWMVFWIDPSLIPSQIALSTASVFSLIAFRFSIRLSLPAVSYMTRIDQFVLGCTVLVFLALGQAVMTGRLAKQGREVLARRLDQWGRWIYLAAFALIVVVYR